MSKLASDQTDLEHPAAGLALLVPTPVHIHLEFALDLAARWLDSLIHVIGHGTSHLLYAPNGQQHLMLVPPTDIGRSSLCRPPAQRAPACGYSDGQDCLHLTWKEMGED